MTARADAADGEGRRILIAFIVATAFVMQGIDSTLLIIAIPTISADLGIDLLLLHLAVTAYLLSLALFMPVSGWFADRFGARTMFIISLVVFTLGSVLAGLSPNLEAMVTARALQGVGGALMTPLGRLIVLRTFGPGRVLDATTWMTLPMMLGPLLGPLIGAAIISFTSWRWIFFVNVPICLAAVACTLIFVPHDRPEGRLPFDVRGFFIAGAALVLFQLSIEHMVIPLLGPAAHLPLFGASGLMLWIYIRYARKKQNPAIDLRVFGIQSFAVGVLGGGLGRIGMNASFLLIPLLLQTGMGMDPMLAAILTSTGAVGAFAAKPLLSLSIRRAGFAWTITALCIVGAVLTASFGGLAFTPDLGILVVFVMLLGAVRGMYFNSLQTLTYADLPKDLLSQGVSSGGVFQQFAMGMGISVSSVILSLLAGSHEPPGLTSFAQTFLIMAVFPLLSVPFILNLRRPPRAATTDIDPVP